MPYLVIQACHGAYIQIKRHLYIKALRLPETYKIILAITSQQNKGMAHSTCYLFHVLTSKEGDFDRIAM